MELHDVRKSITDMTEDEIRAELTGIRSNRRISKKPSIATKKAKAVTEIKTETLMSNINKEQAELLLKMMGEMK